jgi:hypothetical protein
VIKLSSGGCLTLSNIVIDGNKGAGTAGSLIRVENGSLTLNDGAILQNNVSDIGLGSAVWFSAVLFNHKRR